MPMISPCTLKETKVPVINALEISSQKLFKWFSNNFMKANMDKSHLLMSFSGISTPLIDGFSIDSSIKEVLLGITIDKELKFDDHVNNLWKKACQKLNALARITPFMNIEKKRIIMKAFIE